MSAEYEMKNRLFKVKYGNNYTVYIVAKEYKEIPDLFSVFYMKNTGYTAHTSTIISISVILDPVMLQIQEKK